MSAFYLRVKPLQEPSDVLGLDDKSRSRWSFNIAIEKRPSSSSSEDVGLELAEHLEDAGHGTRATTIFVGRKAAVPDGDGPYVEVLINPGRAPEMIQNEDAPNIEKPNGQIVVRAASNSAARTLARAVYDSLAVIKNETIPTP